jgi:hypothetical protein
MQFKISDEQAEVLSTCIKVHEAANKTLQTALNHHSDVMIRNQAISDDQWAAIAEEFGLDLNTHDWIFTVIKGVPYVISQNRQEQANG